MSITITSTTDSEADVALALGLEPTKGPAASGTGSNQPAGAGAPKSGGDSGTPGQQDLTQANQDDPDNDPDDDNAPDGDEEDGGEEEQPPAPGQVAKDKDQNQPPAKPKGGFQKKIDKLTRERSVLETELLRRDRETLELRSQIQELSNKVNKPADSPKPETKVEAPVLRAKPEISDTKYRTYDEYLHDFSAWTNEAIEHNRNSVQTATSAAIQAGLESLKTELKTLLESDRTAVKATQAQTEWEARQAEARTVFPDYNRVVIENANNVTITPTMQRVMRTHPLGAELAYWYGTNAVEVARIAQLDPDSQTLELGAVLKSIEGTRQARQASNPGSSPNAGGGTDGGNPGAPARQTKPSKAPKPAKPAGAKTSGNVVKDYKYWGGENVSYKDYKAARESKTLV